MSKGVGCISNYPDHSNVIKVGPEASMVFSSLFFFLLLWLVTIWLCEAYSLLIAFAHWSVVGLA